MTTHPGSGTIYLPVSHNYCPLLPVYASIYACAAITAKIWSSQINFWKNITHAIYCLPSNQEIYNSIRIGNYFLDKQALLIAQLTRIRLHIYKLGQG